MVLFVYRKESNPSPPLPPPMPRLSSSREARTCVCQDIVGFSSTFRYDHESIVILLIDNNIIFTIATQVWINTG